MRFALELHNLARNNPSTLPLSHIGWATNVQVKSTVESHNPTIDFSFILCSHPQSTLSCRIGGKSFPVARIPAFVFKHPSLVYETFYPESETVEEFFFCYDLSLLEHFRYFTNDTATHLFEIDGAPFVGLIGEAVELCKNVHTFGNVDRLDRLCELLINELVLFKKNAENPDSTQVRAVRAIASHLALHFRENINLKELLNKKELSERTFLRLWDRLFGEPPRKFISRLKITEACRLLNGSKTFSVGEVATHLGFEDIYYFSRFFRKHTGVSPSTWRKRPLLSRNLNRHKRGIAETPAIPHY